MKYLTFISFVLGPAAVFVAALLRIKIRSHAAYFCLKMKLVFSIISCLGTKKHESGYLLTCSLILLRQTGIFSPEFTIQLYKP